jgi:hypothetical protein
MTLVKTDLGFLRIIQIFKIVGRETNNNKGIIGPQTEKTGPNAGKVYPGGGHQYESLVNFRKHDFSEYLKATGFEITLK